MSEQHMYFFIFSIGACTFSTCSFVVFASAAVAHGIIVILIKIVSYFMNIMYKHIRISKFLCNFIHKLRNGYMYSTTYL